MNVELKYNISYNDFYISRLNISSFKFKLSICLKNTIRLVNNKKTKWSLTRKVGHRPTFLKVKTATNIKGL